MATCGSSTKGFILVIFLQLTFQGRPAPRKYLANASYLFIEAVSTTEDICRVIITRYCHVM
jgi:hypothetical protein